MKKFVDLLYCDIHFTAVVWSQTRNISEVCLYKKRKLQPNNPDEHRCKNPQQNSNRPYSTAHKWITHHDQVIFIPAMQGRFDTYESINMIHHIYKMKR